MNQQLVLSDTDSISGRDHDFLEWFAKKFQAPFHFSHIQIGDISYHRASVLQRSHPPFVASGRGATPLEAAQKAISEFIERKMFLELKAKMEPMRRGSCYFDLDGALTLSSSLKRLPDLPQALQTTNGWAVHPVAECAIENAACELIQRHCAISSFLRQGWKGFAVVDELKINGIKFLSCLADLQTGGWGAGVVIGIMPSTGGAAFGCMIDRTIQLQTSSRWLHAFCECYDAIETYDPDRTVSGIEVVCQQFLSQPLFNESQLSGESIPRIEDAPEILFDLYNLQEFLGSPEPIFAAQAKSPDLLPLFFPQLHDKESHSWVRGLLLRHGGYEIPERIPPI